MKYLGIKDQTEFVRIELMGVLGDVYSINEPEGFALDLSIETIDAIWERHPWSKYLELLYG
jgi:hypothetical protein